MKVNFMKAWRESLYKFIVVAVGRSISWFFFLFPRACVRAFAWPLGFLWFDVFKIRRKVILSNLKLAFPEWTDEQRLKVGRRSLYQVTESFLEVFLIPSLTKKWLAQNVVFEGEENLHKALAQGKGVYALSLHLGNGDMAAACLSLQGYPMSLITKIFKNKFFNDVWFFIRMSQGVHLIEPHGAKTPFEILKSIKSNRIVVFVKDQFMGKPYGVQTRFFGVPTGTAFGLAVFYSKTESPIVPVYTFEGNDGKVHIRIDPALIISPQQDNEDQEVYYQRLTQQFTNEIERIVRQYPDQWMWVHRRWKTFE